MITQPNKSLIHQLSWLVVVLVLILSCLTRAAGVRREHLIDAWKPTNYNVSIVFNDKLSEMTSATTEITILCLKDQLAQIDLDFADLPIDSVMVNNKIAPYQRTATQVLV